MKTKILVENLKCRGCSATITQELRQLVPGMTVHVDPVKSLVEIDLKDNNLLPRIKEKLATLGYPEMYFLKGPKRMAARARSLVSCAIGKL